MSGSASTVVSNAQVTISASSPVTSNVIAAVFRAAAASSGIVSYDGIITPTAATPGSTLYVLPRTTGNLSIPSGFSYILFDQTSSVTATGGDSSATVIGDSFNYEGIATLVVSGTGVANIDDDSAGASIDIGSTSTVTAAGYGADQVIQIGAGAIASITSNGSASTVLAGAGSTDTINAGGAGERVEIGLGVGATLNLVGGDTVDVGVGPAAASGHNLIGLNAAGGFGNVYNIGSSSVTSTQDVVLATGNDDTVNVAGGVVTVYAVGTANLVNNRGGTVEFIGSNFSSSTIVGGVGQTTVFALQGAQTFNVGSAAGSNNNNLFLGGSVESTINAGTGGGVFFGGSHGDLYNIGSSTAQTFLGLGGSDTLNGTMGSAAPTVFAINAEHLTFTSSAPRVTLVGLESGGMIDTSQTKGDVEFTGFGSTGNETLVGSLGSTAGASDIYELGAASLGAHATETANITIDNWHSGDVFYLIGYGAADNATMDAATQASTQAGAPNVLQFTLSDQTTVTFVGNHPTGVAAGANAIY